jgi:glycosyltransferase involved in cell wall biosynthesis
LVVTAWGSDIFGFSEQGAISRSLTRRTLRTADLVTCDSEDLRRGIVDLGTDPSRVEIVPFGVDTTMFTPTADPGPAERAIGIAPGVRLVVSPRGIAPTYCTTTLVRAFGQVAEQKDDLVLAVAGPISDTSYEQEVLDLSASLGIRDKVIFAGPQPHAMMPSLYARANVVVSVARTDSSPVSLLEAMATESVVVASDLPGVREWIRDAENGFLSAPDDVKGLAACLGSALSLDAGERSRWTAANRASVERRAEAGPACDLMVHWYETLVRRKLDDAETPGR